MKYRQSSGNNSEVSRVVDILVVVAKLSSQLMDDLLEDHSVYIQSHHVEEEEVTRLGLFDDEVDAVLLDQSEAKVEQVSLEMCSNKFWAHHLLSPDPDLGRDHDEDPVDYDQGRQGPEDQEPEPEEDIDFLVNWIIRQLYLHNSWN